jgi:prevent-host-death family protein
VTKQVNIYEAKSQLSSLIDEVEAGGEIIIARAGKPVARLVPLRREGHDRTPGSLRGKIWMAPDFDGSRVASNCLPRREMSSEAGITA